MSALSRALSPWTLGPLRLRNRVIKAATYEGMTPGGRVSDALVAHHARLAAGGVGLTTVAYGAVHPDGRTFDDQLLVDAAAGSGLRRLVDAVHAEGGAVSLQLAHCGGFSKRRTADGGMPRGPSAGWNAYGLAVGVPRVRAMTEADLDETEAAFVQAAAVSRAAGVDALEVHVGHGYLLHQFLSPATNRRRDRWGGDLRGRLTFPERVVAAVKAVAGPVPVLVKMNLADGHRGGLTLDDALVVAPALVAAGADALVLSGGNVARTPFYLLRGDAPIRGMAAVERHPLQRWAIRLFAPFKIRSYPYSDLFLLDAARRVRAAVDAPLVLLGGVTAAEHLSTAMEAGFEAVQVGRALLHDPDWVRRCQADATWRSGCTHCNECVVEMDRGGVRCTDPESPAVTPASDALATPRPRS